MPYNFDPSRVVGVDRPSPERGSPPVAPTLPDIVDASPALRQAGDRLRETNQRYLESMAQNSRVSSQASEATSRALSNNTQAAQALGAAMANRGTALSGFGPALGAVGTVLAEVLQGKQASDADAREVDAIVRHQQWKMGVGEFSGGGLPALSRQQNPAAGDEEIRRLISEAGLPADRVGSLTNAYYGALQSGIANQVDVLAREQQDYDNQVTTNLASTAIIKLSALEQTMNSPSSPEFAQAAREANEIRMELYRHAARNPGAYQQFAAISSRIDSVLAGAAGDAREHADLLRGAQFQTEFIAYTNSLYGQGLSAPEVHARGQNWLIEKVGEDNSLLGIASVQSLWNEAMTARNPYMEELKDRETRANLERTYRTEQEGQVWELERTRTVGRIEQNLAWMLPNLLHMTPTEAREEIRERFPEIESDPTGEMSYKVDTILRVHREAATTAEQAQQEIADAAADVIRYEDQLARIYDGAQSTGSLNTDTLQALGAAVRTDETSVETLLALGREGKMEEAIQSAITELGLDIDLEQFGGVAGIGASIADPDNPLDPQLQAINGYVLVTTRLEEARAKAAGRELDALTQFQEHQRELEEIGFPLITLGTTTQIHSGPLRTYTNGTDTTNRIREFTGRVAREVEEAEAREEELSTIRRGPPVQSFGNGVTLARVSGGTDDAPGIVPIAQGTPGFRVSSSFGYRTEPYEGFHEGVDLAAPRGTPVYSQVHGTVVYNAHEAGYGNLVAVVMDDGTELRYGHLMAPSNLSVGTRVQPGDILGGVGSTGRSTGPHLHWEVRVGGEPINPLQWSGSATAPRTAVTNPDYTNLPMGIDAAAIVLEDGKVLQDGVMFNGDESVSDQEFTPENPLEWDLAPGTAQGYGERDLNGNFGYRILDENPRLRSKVHHVAADLGIPSQWLADWLSLSDFGRGNQSIGAVGMELHGNVFQQLTQLSQMKQDDSRKPEDFAEFALSMLHPDGDLIQLYRDNPSRIGDMYAELTDREGNVYRMTIRDYVMRIGNAAGRMYDTPWGQAFRESQPVHSSPHPGCRLCADMAASGQFVPHRAQALN